MKKDEREIERRFLEVYCGILFHAQAFQKGEAVACSYEFSDKRYGELKARYPVAQTAGRGSDFERALRLCRWLASNLEHRGDFIPTDGTEENSLSLLDFSFGKRGRGINCVCKAKILAECCLALGIYARRVWLYPNSPYDGDCHAVVEIFDRATGRWTMLDPTWGAYFTDGASPLSCLETRKNFAAFATGSAVLPRQRVGDMKTLAERNLARNVYYAKNCYYMAVETVSGFGVAEGARFAFLLPVGFDCKAQYERNAVWRLEFARRERFDEAVIAWLQELSDGAKSFSPRIASEALWNPPI